MAHHAWTAALYAARPVPRPRRACARAPPRRPPERPRRPARRGATCTSSPSGDGRRRGGSRTGARRPRDRGIRPGRCACGAWSPASAWRRARGSLCSRARTSCTSTSGCRPPGTSSRPSRLGPTTWPAETRAASPDRRMDSPTPRASPSPPPMSRNRLASTLPALASRPIARQHCVRRAATRASSVVSSEITRAARTDSVATDRDGRGGRSAPLARLPRRRRARWRRGT